MSHLWLPVSSWLFGVPATGAVLYLRACRSRASWSHQSKHLGGNVFSLQSSSCRLNHFAILLEHPRRHRSGGRACIQSQSLPCRCQLCPHCDRPKCSLPRHFLSLRRDSQDGCRVERIPTVFFTPPSFCPPCCAHSTALGSWL